MMAAIIFGILFAACLTGIVCYPKTAGKINGAKALVAGGMAILCGQAVLGLFLVLLHIRAVLPGIGIAMLLAAAALWYGIRRKGCVQRLFWKSVDIISLLVLAIVVCMVSLHMFGVGLKLQYPGVGASENFLAAMHIVRGEAAENVKATTVIEAVCIRMYASFAKSALYYKGFILAEMFLQLMEVWMLYVVMISLSEKKIVRLLAPVLCIACFMGYPAYNYMMGNDETLIGTSLAILSVVYVLRHSAVQAALKRATARGRALPWVLFGAVLFGVSLAASLAGAKAEREIYASLYGDLIFFVPVVLYVCYYAFFKGKAGRELCGISLAMLGCTAILYVFWYNDRITNYNYYRNYAILWLLGWLLAVLALDISVEMKEAPQFFSYAGLVVILAVLSLSGIEESGQSTTELDGTYAARNLFSLYRYNMDCLSNDYGAYGVSEEFLAACEDVAENYSGEETPLLTEEDDLRMWYDAFTDNDSSSYSLALYGLPEVAGRLETDGIRMIAVTKDTQDYQNYRSYFEQCPASGGNDAVVLYGLPGDDWTDVYAKEDADYEEKLELFTYVKEELEGVQAPLVAGKESCIAFIMYEDVTGMDSAAFYTWEYGVREYIANLELQDVRYVTLLKEDSYYAANGGYYAGQDVVFENDAGMVVRCSGEAWIIGKEN